MLAEVPPSQRTARHLGERRSIYRRLRFSFGELNIAESNRSYKFYGLTFHRHGCFGDAGDGFFQCWWKDNGKSCCTERWDGFFQELEKTVVAPRLGQGETWRYGKCLT